jgi:4a-hydroxytetrahydrobiopterin dehydratase
MTNEGETLPIDLTKKHCVPCEIGTQPFDLETINGLLPVVPEWKLEDTKIIKRGFRFKDFVEAMKFVNKVADIAESEGHHPDIFISYNYVRIMLTTHNIGGLSENDFIMAAKINELYIKEHTEQL